MHYLSNWLIRTIWSDFSDEVLGRFGDWLHVFRTGRRGRKYAKGPFRSLWSHSLTGDGSVRGRSLGIYRIAEIEIGFQFVVVFADADN